MKFNSNQHNIVAAIFAHTNMGQANPSVDAIKRLSTSNVITLGGAVNYFSGNLMESDEDYSMFVDEARSWLKDKDTVSIEKIRKVWPDLGALFAEAWPELVAPAKPAKAPKVTKPVKLKTAAKKKPAAKAKKVKARA